MTGKFMKSLQQEPWALPAAMNPEGFSTSFRDGRNAGVLGGSRKWLGKIEPHDLWLDVLCLVRLCHAYGIKASRLIREMEEEPSEDDDFSLGILQFLFCQFCFASIDNCLNSVRKGEKCLD